MTTEFQQFTQIGGEIAPALYGRSDLEKYDLSLALAENWFIDYHGGLVSSPGLEFCELLPSGEGKTKFFPFKFSTSISNTYLLIFGDKYVRFLQDGSYVVESEKSVSSIRVSSSSIFTVNNHGYATGDLVKVVNPGNLLSLVNVIFIIGTVTANSFEILSIDGSTFPNLNFSSYVSGLTVARVYTIVSPYTKNDLSTLRGNQIRDSYRFTNKNYPIYTLTRNDSANWVFIQENLANTALIPTNVLATPFSSGAYDCAYVVTHISANGTESLPSSHVFVKNCSKEDGARLSWTPIAGSIAYNIYRTRLSIGNAVTRSSQTGYIGESIGAYFVDSSFITPDFSKTPPTYYDPFAPGRIDFVSVKNAGSGYNNNSVVTVTDPTGTGYIGYPVVDDTGKLSGIVTVVGGKNYTAPIFNVSIGTNAVVEAEIGPTSGTYPATSVVFLRRQFYAAPENSPLGVFVSRPGKLSNFGASAIQLANDGFDFEIDSEDASPLQHLVPSRGGLIAMNAYAIWLLSGTSGKSITAIDKEADLQVYEGANELVPLSVGTEIYYCSNAGGFPHQLNYNTYVTRYATVDISILASHLLPKGKKIVAWAYANNPHKLIWAVRNDGIIINITVLKDQEVYAWSRRVTQGKFIDVATLEEVDISSVYVKTERLIKGKLQYGIERVKSRQFNHVEESFCVDNGLSASINQPNATLSLSAGTGNAISVLASVPIFSITDVGNVIRAAGGKFNVISFVSSTQLTVEAVRNAIDYVHCTDVPVTSLAGEWSLDKPKTKFYGFYHLAGEKFTGLADGNVVNGTVAADGSITLINAVTRFSAGQGYKCTTKNLPLTLPGNVVENKRKRILSTAVRVNETSGLKAGTSLDSLYEIAARKNEVYGESTQTAQGMITIMLDPLWTDDASCYFVQDEPLPATILGYLFDVEVGDDKS